MFAALDSVSSPSPPDPVAPPVLDALAEKLVNTTLLRTPSKEWLSRLREMLSTTPPDTQQRWVEYLTRRMANVRNQIPCATCSSSSWLGMVMAQADAGVCPTCGGVREDPLHLLGNVRLTEMRLRQIEGLLPTDDCVARLNRDFSTLCNAAERIDIVDPYAVTDALRSLGSSGLERFLSMAQSGGVREVRIVTGIGGSIKSRQLTASELVSKAAVISKAAGLNAAELRLIVVKAADRQRLMHDRFVGFSWGSGGQASWCLGRGLSQFNGSRPGQTHALSRQQDGFVAQLGSMLTSKAVLNSRIR